MCKCDVQFWSDNLNAYKLLKTHIEAIISIKIPLILNEDFILLFLFL